MFACPVARVPQVGAIETEGEGALEGATNGGRGSITAVMAVTGYRCALLPVTTARTYWATESGSSVPWSAADAREFSHGSSTYARRVSE